MLPLRSAHGSSFAYQIYSTRETFNKGVYGKSVLRVFMELEKEIYPLCPRSSAQASYMQFVYQIYSMCELMN